MTRIPPRPIELLDGRITGVAVDSPGPIKGPLIVHLHGGATCYMEAVRENFSILGIAADIAFPGVSLNRPGYEGSEWLGIPPTQDEGLYDQSALRIGEALDELWKSYQDVAPGIVLWGCSVGAPISLIIANHWADGSQGWQWPLFGVIATDVGHLPKPGIKELWDSTPVEDFLDDLGVFVDRLDFGPEWTRYQDPADAEPDGVSAPPALGKMKLPRAECQEITGAWVRNALNIASGVTVPVYWRLSEFDPLWYSTPEAVDEFVSALRQKAPFVDGAVMRAATHPVHEGPMRRYMVLDALAFAELCFAIQKEPSILERLS